MFIGAIIYIGVYEELDISMYWNTDFNKGLYIHFQAIFHSADSSKLNDIAISLVLRVVKKRGITYLLIRSSGIKLNL